MIATRDIIVVGGSAGGMDALRRLIGALPAGLPAAILMVIHTHPTGPLALPQILARDGPLPVAAATDGEPIVHGRILIAPPDHHLLIEGDHVRLTKGPKENHSRPAVDALFRSAAYFYGPRVIGVALSGIRDDGTAGLWTIKDRGGCAVVQAPEDSELASMPETALRHVAVDHRLPVSEIGSLLARLVQEPVPDQGLPPPSSLLALETRIAMGDHAMEPGMLQLGDLSPCTCPECHGVLLQLQEGRMLRYRCHTGHAFSANALLLMLTESIEDSLWSTVRGIEESVMLMRHMAQHLANVGDTVMAARFEVKAEESDRRAKQIKQLALQHEQLSADQVMSGEGTHHSADPNRAG